MLLLFIKLWIKNRVMYSYYRRTNVTRGHVAEAVRFSTSITALNGIDNRYAESVKEAQHYSEKMLGHFMMNQMASVPFSTFKEILGFVPQVYRYNEEDIVQWVGGQSMLHSSVVIWSNFVDVPIETVFGVTARGPVRIDTYTRQRLPLIDNTANWNSYIMEAMNIHLTKAERDADAMRFSKISRDSYKLSSTVDILEKVALNYNIPLITARIRRLKQTITQEGI